MSRILEALHRSEADRSGETFLAPVECIADLLRSEERETHKADAFSSAAILHPTLAADAHLVCLTDQDSLGAEKFRVLGLNLQHLRDKRKLKRVVITSTSPEEGKSLVAANLALNQGRSNSLKTILVEGDLRQPVQASRFGFSRNLPGLSEYLRGERSLAYVVYRLESAGLWFLPAGVTTGNPVELMQSVRLAELLDHLETFFDWIIIDTPPIFPLADATLWMKLADGVLIVTRIGVSDKKLLAQAVKALERSTLLGLVVNSCQGHGQRYFEKYYSRATEKKMEKVEFGVSRRPAQSRA
jgi:capsular exopolysaccharide synthesis family protein